MFNIFNWKKSYFRKKLKGVECMMADLEFKRFKAREIREEIRIKYDAEKARLSALETQIEQQAKAPTMEKGEIARLDDTKIRLTNEIKGYESQMRGIDIEIIGSEVNDEYPQGVVGLNDQLEALRELITLIKDYSKKL